MSQKVRILGARVRGHVFVGCVRPVGEGPAAPVWTSDPETVMAWLCAGWRTRFNDHRAWRGRYVYADGQKVTDSSGEPILVALGRDPLARSKAECRRDRPHLAAIPDPILESPARLENEEWWAAAKRRATLTGKGRRAGRMPGLQRRNTDARFVCWHTKGKNAVFTQTGRRSGLVTITGMNPAAWKGDHPSRWSVQIRVRLSQPIRTYTSVRVNWTRRELVFVNPPAAVTKKKAGGTAVGLDLGVARTIAVAEGTFYDQPGTADLDTKIAWHSRRMAKARRVNNPTGAKNWTPTRGYLRHRAARASAHAAKTARLDDWRHKVTTGLVRTHDLIAIEDLDVKNMTKSSRGTLTNPGTRVAQKTGLNRSLAQAAFGTLRAMLAYKTTALIRAGHHQELLAVPPRNTSRRCNACGHTAKENRKSQAVFLCTACGHTANADTNASSNVLDAALQLWARTDEAGESTPRRSNAVGPAGSQDEPSPPAGVLPSGAGGTGEEPRTPRSAA